MATTTASPALCFYCFEVLAGAFQDVQPPRLAAVQTLYEEYTKDLVEQEKQRKRQQQQQQQQQPLNVLLDVDAEKWKVTISTWRDIATATPPAKKIGPGDDGDGTGNAWAAGTSLATKLAETSATEYPLFVTWNVLSSDGEEKRLRGCIGTFEPQALEFGLNSFTIQSAFHDPRFRPIRPSLLPALSASITLLSNFEPCAPLDWVVGVHGIRISFVAADGRRRYGATYLPDVAREQGWGKEETLRSLMRKAGFETAGLGSRPWEGDGVKAFVVVRYQGLKASAGFREWMAFREWVGVEEGRLGVLAMER